jgi:hypothetical protein
MKNIGALLVIAFLAVMVLVFVTNPDLLSKIWLYLIGFIGYVVVLIEKGYKSLSSAFTFSKEKTKEAIPSDPIKPVAVLNPISPVVEKNSEISQLEQKIKDLEFRLNNAKSDTGTALGSCTLTILRYLDDGETTLGLIFLRNKFFAYTLEDTHNEVKVAKKTRIPAGVFPIDFYRIETDLTKKYRRIYGDWFDYHLEIKDIPNFQNVYIHVGNTHENTDGCILIADGVSAGTSKSLQYSRNAYERFYKTISALLKSNEPVTIQILNEDWFERSKISSL